MPPNASEIIDFTVERGRHAQFLGREDVLAAVGQHLSSDMAPSGWVLITGGPGLGKSAVLARRLALAEAVGRRVPHHFLRRGVADWDRPEAVARSLAAQIEALYPEQADAQATPERRLLDLVARVSRDALVPRGERLLLVVDGLDEAAASPGDNPLPFFLPYAPPAGVWVLCASRASIRTSARCSRGTMFGISISMTRPGPAPTRRFVARTGLVRRPDLCRRSVAPSWARSSRRAKGTCFMR